DPVPRVRAPVPRELPARRHLDGGDDPADADADTAPEVSAVRLESRSEAETERFAETLAALLGPGDVIALEGALGAGKTRFVAGLARGIAARARVRSPTFTLVHEYPGGRVTLVHADLYRLETAEVGGLGLEEALDRAALVV